MIDIISLLIYYVVSLSFLFFLYLFIFVNEPCSLFILVYSMKSHSPLICFHLCGKETNLFENM